MILNVPFFEQERSLTCGVAVLRMILGFYGEKVTEKELAKKVKMHSFGTYSTDLAVLAMEKGYKATAYTLHLPLFASLNLPFGTRITLDYFRKIKLSPGHKSTFQTCKNYVEKGGELIWEQPKISRVQSWLDKKNPVFISANTASLNTYWKNWHNGHYYIIEGYDEENAFVINPDRDKKDTRYKIPWEKLLPAWSINAAQSSDHLMVIYK
ncbi:C39 family peptidase [Candidatus Microgenomates bacterium]|nr:C39 family peptidase [Candidatus Microgenomates bacterium]